MPASLDRRVIAIGLFAGMVAVGIFSVWLATRPPAISIAAASPELAIVTLAAGIALATAGCVALVRHPDEPFGRRIVVAAFAWFVVGWSNPGSDIPVLFTAGLVFGAAYPAIVAHALAGSALWHARRHARALVLLGYATCIGLVGLAPALLRAPDALCPVCPANLVGLVGAAELGAWIGTVGLALAAAWAGAVVAYGLQVIRTATAAARRSILPVAVPGLAAMALFGGHALVSVPSGAIGVGQLDRILWALQAAALIGIALGVALRVIRSRATRDAVAAIVLELAGSVAAGGLQDRLRALFGDSTLVLAYPAGEGRLVSAGGDPTFVASGDGRHVTPLVRDGHVIAMVEHRAGLEDDADRMTELFETARLALEHERLVAEARARLVDVRASRARVVAATDRERRRLERDLHDGAQQRLASLAIAIRMARAQLKGSGRDAAAARALDEAEAELRAAIADVREIGHGIYPAVLMDLGLAAAVSALSEESAIPYRIDALPAGRFGPAVESTAYFLIAETPALTGAKRARIEALVDDERLRIVLELEHARPVDLTELEDRVGALDGTLLTASDAGALLITAEIPCAS